MKIKLWLRWAASISVALVLVSSAYFHLNNPVGFLEAVLQYRLVFGKWALAVSILLPAVQLLAASWLVLCFEKRLGGLLSAALCMLFVVVQVSALWRGLSIDCGCFGDYSAMVSPYTVAGVGGLLVVSVALALSECGHGEQPQVRLQANRHFAGPGES